MLHTVTRMMDRYPIYSDKDDGQISYIVTRMMDRYPIYSDKDDGQISYIQ